MFTSLWRAAWFLLRSLFVLGLLALLAPRLTTALYALTRIYAIEAAPKTPVAIVFGAGLQRDGSPTAVLRDRVATGAALYRQGKVEKLLLSGDRRLPYYNEPEAMKRYALGLGVPEEAIVLDYAGHRTYDTCYRAKTVFGVSEALLVTQRFHLPRALYTCQALGLSAAGVSADQRRYRFSSLLFWNLRELFATAAAFLDIHLIRPLPILDEPQPISPVHSQ